MAQEKTDLEQLMGSIKAMVAAKGTPEEAAAIKAHVALIQELDGRGPVTVPPGTRMNMITDFGVDPAKELAGKQVGEFAGGTGVYLRAGSDRSAAQISHAVLTQIHNKELAAKSEAELGDDYDSLLRPKHIASPPPRPQSLQQADVGQQQVVNSPEPAPSAAPVAATAQAVPAPEQHEPAPSRRLHVQGDEPHLIGDRPPVVKPLTYVARPEPSPPHQEERPPQHAPLPRPKHIEAPNAEPSAHAQGQSHGVEDTKTFQRSIKAMGGDFDLGATGKGKDGVDGDWGPKTQAAFEKVCKAAGVDPKDVNLSEKPANKASEKLASYMDKQIQEHTRAKAQEHVTTHVREEKAASTAIERANIPEKVEQEVRAAMALDFGNLTAPATPTHRPMGASQGAGR